MLPKTLKTTPTHPDFHRKYMEPWSIGKVVFMFFSKQYLKVYRSFKKQQSMGSCVPTRTDSFQKQET